MNEELFEKVRNAYYKNAKCNIETLRAGFLFMFGIENDFVNLNDQQKEALRDTYIEELQKRLSEIPTEGGIDKNKKNQWFLLDDWKRTKSSTYLRWNDYLNKLLENEPNLSEEDKNSLYERISIIADDSQKIVNHLPNPITDNTELHRTKGLIYGDVQSGKTGTMEGLAAMYADSGCKFIFVLSGITNSLRKQTYERFLEDLNLQHSEGRWECITPNPDSDFVPIQYTAPDGFHPTTTVIGFFKKNPCALRRLNEYVRNVGRNNFWLNKQILIIDDESDQYSPNVARDFVDENGETYTHSTINQLILELLNYFQKASYVGFSATPYANMLNDLPGENSLFPEDFIDIIHHSDNYFGADKIFNGSSTIDETEETHKKLDIIEYITDNDDIKAIDDLLHGEVFECNNSMKDAIMYFLLSTACKKRRNIIKHTSMLIHVDMRTRYHDKIASGVNNFIKELKDNYDNKKAEFKEIWNKQKNKISVDTVCELFPKEKKSYFIIPEFEELEDDVKELLDEISVVVDNSTQNDENRLHYNNEIRDWDDCQKVIVIGGNTLARGITLEGLTVSYFVRASNNADTLLQMGRWFGYRPHYEDLVRLWIDANTKAKFEEITENLIFNLIEDIKNTYGRLNKPEDLLPRIRALDTLNITHEVAMQRAVLTLACSKVAPETHRLNRTDDNVINSNLAVTKDFLDSLPKDKLMNNGELYHNSYIYEGIPVEQVLDYLSKYSFTEKDRNCTSAYILNTIQKFNDIGMLKNWNVVLKQKLKGEKFNLSETYNNIGLIDRSCRKEVDESICYIRIHEPRDFKIDLDDATWSKEKNSTAVSSQLEERKKYYDNKGMDIPGLLLIYPLNPKTPEKLLKNGGVDIDAKAPLIGLTFAFPPVNDNNFQAYYTLENNDATDNKEL